MASFAVLADDSPSWRPSEYRVDVLGCRHVMSFPTAKLLDHEHRLAELKQDIETIEGKSDTVMTPRFGPAHPQQLSSLFDDEIHGLPMARTLVTLDHIDGITIDPADAPFGNYQAVRSSDEGLKTLTLTVRELER